MTLDRRQMSEEGVHEEGEEERDHRLSHRQTDCRVSQPLQSNSPQVSLSLFSLPFDAMDDGCITFWTREIGGRSPFPIGGKQEEGMRLSVSRSNLSSRDPVVPVCVCITSLWAHVMCDARRDG